ncbi:MAG: undecaprenyl-diphosphate phosphatase [Desulfococcaceae bacterium]
MDVFHAVVLGIIQGLTEFLPVSSSGHLVIFQHLFGLREAELFFDISVHTGTLIAVIIFFRKEIISILASLVRFGTMLWEKKISPAAAMQDADVKLALLIIAGSVPTAVIGLLFHKMAEQIFSSVFLVGWTLIITGVLVWVTKYVKGPVHGIEDFSVRQALCIGFVQGIAILPGISRSGSTIAAGLFLGLDGKTAARYSFLMSIPAIAGAQILVLKDLGGTGADMNALYGAISAGLVGYAALALLVYIVNKGRLFIFAPYCWIVGFAALIYSW